MRMLRMRLIASIATFVLMLVSYRVNAGTSELSVTIGLGFPKSRTSTVIHTGDTIDYTVTTTNNGTAGINVPTDIFFPQQILPSGGSGTGFSCSLISRVTLHCITTSLLLPNSPRTISITARAPLTITGDSQAFPVKAKIDPADFVKETNETDNEDTYTTTVVPRGSDLAVDLTGSDNSASGGEEIKYLVKLKNAGDRPSTESTFRATLPLVIPFSRIENSQFATCFPSTNSISCTIGHDKTLAPGAAASVTIVGLVDRKVDSSVVTFAATAIPNYYDGDANQANNSATVNTTLTELADLVVVSTSYLSFTCGDFSVLSPTQPATTYDILKAKVKNEGHTNSPAIKVRMSIFNGAAIMLNDGTDKQRIGCDTIVSTNCNATGSATATCDIGPLAPGGSQDLSYTIVRNTGNSYQVEFKADPTNEVTESHDTNNVTTQSVR